MFLLEIQIIVGCNMLDKLVELCNQRTNGPVNAHLKHEIYTCTNKLVRLEWYSACI